MRALTDAARLATLMRALGEEADGETRIYFTGGATAVLFGWRASTIDVDLKIVPDRDRLYRALPALKERLQINLELAAPDDFIAVRDGWEDRSPFIRREGRVSFHHFDLYAQALAKVGARTQPGSGGCQGDAGAEPDRRRRGRRVRRGYRAEALSLPGGGRCNLPQGRDGSL